MLENNQNKGCGVSPPRHTANKAVHKGNKPTNTMVCAEVVCCKAKAVSSGKPTTTPTTTHNKAGKSWRLGWGCFNSHSSGASG